MPADPSAEAAAPLRAALRDAALDLFLGSSCEGCARPGRMLCAGCREGLPRVARPAWPDPSPPGLAVPWVAAAYDGAVRRLVLGHKEHARHAHRRVLGGLLAASVGAATRELDPAVPLVLVPVPSRPGVVRRRGHDPTTAIARSAARTLGRGPGTVVVARLLVSRGGVADQAGLGTAERAANVAGSMWCPSARVRRLVRRLGTGPGSPDAPPALHLVVCDDVLTTGATVREAQRALEAVGLPPVALATVAATRRRGSSDPSLPPLAGRG